jgi:hypothetical protein
MNVRFVEGEWKSGTYKISLALAGMCPGKPLNEVGSAVKVP